MLGNSGIFYALAVFYASCMIFRLFLFTSLLGLMLLNICCCFFFCLFNLNVGFTFGWFFFPFTILSNQAVRM